MTEIDDQYVSGGAPNFESALGTAAQVYSNLSEEAQEELVLMVVGRYGEVTLIGSGENLPSNEEGPQSGGFIVYCDDIVSFLDSNDESGEEEEEEEEAEDEEDLGCDERANSTQEPTLDPFYYVSAPCSGSRARIEYLFFWA